MPSLEGLVAIVFLQYVHVVIWVFGRIKIFMIIFFELVDLIDVIGIKVFAPYAEVSFDRFGKELYFVSICPGDYVIMAQCWIILMAHGLEEVLDLVPRLALVSL